ncbi:NUDIX hydrolase [Nocardioides pelophilus]|uniref:NUDIX hydrolase n=1 Tax=Nocardioides pelophilus TaxID=2172019 RepID=UPI001602490F|nr:NUDIX domain-containing protein [Nocardioides pelophilus]
MSAPINRVAARVLPVNPAGEVLLLQGQDPAHPGDLHWVSVGGAVDPGESLAAAGVREMLEETGLVVPEDALVGPVHRASHPFSWAGVAYLSDNHFFAVPLDAEVDVHFGGLEEAEIGNILQAQWWTPEALRTDGTAASPDLPDIMATAIDAVLGGAR